MVDFSAHAVVLSAAGSATAAGQVLTGPVDSLDKLVRLLEWHCHIIRNVLQPRRVRACLPESGWGGVRIRQRCRVWRHRAIERIGLSSGFATRWH